MEQEVEKLNKIMAELKDQEDSLTEDQKVFLYTELGSLISGLGEDVNEYLAELDAIKAKQLIEKLD